MQRKKERKKERKKKRTKKKKKKKKKKKYTSKKENSKPPVFTKNKNVSKLRRSIWFCGDCVVRIIRIVLATSFL